MTILNFQDPRTLAYILLGGAFVLGFVLSLIFVFIVGKIKKQRQRKKEELPQNLPILPQQPLIQSPQSKPQFQQPEPQIQTTQQIPQQTPENPSKPLKMEKWVTYDEAPEYKTQLYQEVKTKKIEPKLPKKLKGGKHKNDKT